MRNSIGSVTVLGLCLISVGGCGTKVFGPALYKIPVATACTPAMATRNCAPSFGSPYIIANRQARLITLNGDTPRVMEYLGRVVETTNGAGVPGVTCGNLTTSPFDENAWVASDSDGQGGDVDFTVTNDLLRTTRISSNAKVNLVNALKLVPNVPQNIDQLLAGDLTAAYDRLETVTVSAQGRFQQYQLRYADLNALNIGDFSGVADSAKRAALTACRAQLIATDGGKPSARMYQALTGFLVTSLSIDTAAVTTVAGTLAAKVKTAAPEADLAQIRAELERTSIEAVRTRGNPVFVVTGLSFWQPIRIPASPAG